MATFIYFVSFQLWMEESEPVRLKNSSLQQDNIMQMYVRLVLNTAILDISVRLQLASGVLVTFVTNIT